MSNSFNVMCILFEKCNLNCKFCFEKENRNKNINMDYLFSLPYAIVSVVSDKFESGEFNALDITFMGGELFADTLPDKMFAIYGEIVSMIGLLMFAKYPKVDIRVNWLTNGVFQKYERVERLLSETGGKISFSYDPVGRYPSNVQKTMFLENVEYFRDYLGSILITPTKPTINAFINGESDIDFLRVCCKNLDLSYYIAGKDYKELQPSDSDMFKFFKWIVDNEITEFKDYREMLKAFDKRNPEIFKTCNCDKLITVSERGITNVCVKINSPLPLSDFYGDKKITEQNVAFYRENLGQQKRGCMTCPWFDKCVKPCWTTVLFKNYPLQKCPFKRIYEYIKDKHSVVDNADLSV